MLSDTVKLITVQFLGWVADRPRSYAEVAEAWRSTCPTTCAWEDALNDDLVRFEAGARSDQSKIVLTKRGRAVLEAGGATILDRGAQADASKRSTTANSSAG